MSEQRKILEISRKEFLKFLIEAKKECYASGREAEIDFKTGEKVLTYYNHIEGFFSAYEDRYSGYFEAPGREIVSVSYEGYNGKLPPISIWAMCYGFGKQDGLQKPYESNKEVAHQVFAFLKEMLQNPDPHLPVRGPRREEREDWRYYFQFTGGIACFKGDETIANDKYIPDTFPWVFQQQISGGLIQHKDLEIKLV